LKKAISFTDTVTLSHDQNVFSIDFSTLSYMDAATDRYRYMLEKLDKGWHEVGSDQRQVTYTTLPSGTYTFHVQGSIRGGAWGEPGTTLKIIVRPAWWNSWWFRSAYIALALFLLWIAYRIRLRQVTVQESLRLEGRLGERMRIARELHDTLLQGFQALVLRIQAAMSTLPDGAPGHHRMMQELVRAERLLQEGRQRVRDLRKESMAGDDLPASLTLFGKDFAQDQKTAFTVSVIGTPRPIDPAVCNEVYRIGREAIANAFQHSGAANIRTEIGYEDDGLRLVVSDDGCGMSEETQSSGRVGHWGLCGLRERAEELGAALNIRSLPGNGTDVSLKIPRRVAYSDQLRQSPWTWIQGRIRGILG
jgi:signal transduction histidine kinase